MQKVEIKTIGDKDTRTEILIDGRRIENVRSFRLEQEAGKTPALTLDLNAINVSVDKKIRLYEKNSMHGMRIVFEGDEPSEESS